MPMGSIPCFPSVLGVGRQLKVQTETHSLMLCIARAQRLRGLSAPLTTRIAHVTCQGGRVILSFFKLQLLQLLQI